MCPIPKSPSRSFSQSIKTVASAAPAVATKQPDGTDISQKSAAMAPPTKDEKTCAKGFEIVLTSGHTIKVFIRIGPNQANIELDDTMDHDADCFCEMCQVSIELHLAFDQCLALSKLLATHPMYNIIVKRMEHIRETRIDEITEVSVYCMYSVVFCVCHLLCFMWLRAAY